MGSLLLAGAVQGLGKGMIANAEADRRTKERDLDKQHDVALQRMRETQADKNREDIQTFATESRAADVQTAQDVLTEGRTYASGLVGPAQEREDVVREDEQSADLDLERLKQYGESLKTRSTTTKDNKWRITRVKKGETTQFGYIPTDDTLVMVDPTGSTAMTQKGAHFIMWGLDDKETKTAIDLANNPSEEMKNDTKILMSLAGTKDDISAKFASKYGSLPIIYTDKAPKQQGQTYSEFSERYRTPATPAPQPAVPTTLPPRTSMDDTVNLAPAPGLLSEGASVTPEQTAVPLLDTQVTSRREKPDIQLEELEEIISLKESRKGRKYFVPPEAKVGRWIQDMIEEKPWIKSLVARQRMGLPLSDEQIAQLKQTVDAAALQAKN